MSAQTDSEQTAEHTITVVRTVDVPVQDVWAVLTTRIGSEALLGPDAILGSKGEHWRSADGHHGVVRSFHPLEQIRFSWHETEDDDPSLVDLHVTQDGEGTKLLIEHQHLRGHEFDDWLQKHWTEALDRVVAASK